MKEYPVGLRWGEGQRRFCRRGEGRGKRGKNKGDGGKNILKNRDGKGIPSLFRDEKQIPSLFRDGK